MLGKGEAKQGVSIENEIGIVVGIQVFLLLFLIKIPVKWFHEKIVVRSRKIDKGRLFRRLNFTLILWVVFLSVSIYFWICLKLGIHHKLCCSFKSVAIALTLYAIYEQLFGEA